jgi:hypothetical protein
MTKGIRIGASLADFMEGTNFAQCHSLHDATQWAACDECGVEYTHHDYLQKVAVYDAAANGTKLVATKFQIHELIYVADLAQDTLDSTGEFSDKGRAAAIRRSIASWEKLLQV